jgi:hypothetical protein
VFVENVRRKQVAWIEAILRIKAWKPYRLASEADISHATLSKFLNDPAGAAQLNSYSVEKIAAAAGMPPYITVAPQLQRGFAETEAEPYVAEPEDPLQAAIAAIIAGRNGIDPWVMKSRALEAAGILPGDIMIVDLNAGPVDGRPVCAQLYDRQGRAETVFRLYEKPFLVAASHDAALRRPVLIDDERVIIRGTVIASLRA